MKHVGTQTEGRAKNRQCNLLPRKLSTKSLNLSSLHPVIQVKEGGKKSLLILQTILEMVVAHMKEPDFSALRLSANSAAVFHSGRERRR